MSFKSKSSKTTKSTKKSNDFSDDDEGFGFITPPKPKAPAIKSPSDAEIAAEAYNRHGKPIKKFVDTVIKNFKDEFGEAADGAVAVFVAASLFKTQCVGGSGKTVTECRNPAIFGYNFCAKHKNSARTAKAAPGFQGARTSFLARGASTKVTLPFNKKNDISIHAEHRFLFTGEGSDATIVGIFDDESGQIRDLTKSEKKKAQQCNFEIAEYDEAVERIKPTDLPKTNPSKSGGYSRFGVSSGKASLVSGPKKKFGGFAAASEESSDEEDAPKKGGKKFSKKDDSSDEEDVPKKKTAPAKKNVKKEESSSDEEDVPKKGGKKTAKKDDSSSSEEDVPKKKTATPAAKKTAKKEESSSDEEDVPKKKTATPAAKKTAKKEESSSDEEDVPKKKTATPAAKKTATPAAKKDVKKDDSSSSDEDVPKKKTATPAAKKEESSSEDEQDVPVKKTATPAKKDDSSSDEEDTPPPPKSQEKKTATPAKKDDSSSDEEDTPPPPKSQEKKTPSPASKTAVKKTFGKAKPAVIAPLPTSDSE